MRARETISKPSLFQGKEEMIENVKTHPRIPPGLSKLPGKPRDIEDPTDPMHQRKPRYDYGRDVLYSKEGPVLYNFSENVYIGGVVVLFTLVVMNSLK